MTRYRWRLDRTLQCERCFLVMLALWLALVAGLVIGGAR